MSRGTNKIATHRHSAEQCLREVESVLEKHGYRMTIGPYNQVRLVRGGDEKPLLLMDTESGSYEVGVIPRVLDTERLKVEE